MQSSRSSPLLEMVCYGTLALVLLVHLSMINVRKNSTMLCCRCYRQYVCSELTDSTTETKKHLGANANSHRIRFAKKF